MKLAGRKKMPEHKTWMKRRCRKIKVDEKQMPKHKTWMKSRWMKWALRAETLDGWMKGHLGSG